MNHETRKKILDSLPLATKDNFTPLILATMFDDMAMFIKHSDALHQTSGQPKGH